MTAFAAAALTDEMHAPSLRSGRGGWHVAHPAGPRALGRGVSILRNGSRDTGRLELDSAHCKMEKSMDEPNLAEETR